MKKKTTGIIILAVVLLTPVIWGIFLKSADFTYTELPTYTRDVLGDTIPYEVDTFTLYDQHGNVFTRDSLNGKVFIANFFFTSCPDICPEMNGNVKIATQKLVNSTDVMFVSFTVDPEVDSVSVLNEYAKDYEADYEQWRFLTGSKSTIYHLAAESFIAAVAGATESSDFIHSEKLALIDREFHIRGIYESRDAIDLSKLVKDARFLLKCYKDQDNER